LAFWSLILAMWLWLVVGVLFLLLILRRCRLNTNLKNVVQEKQSPLFTIPNKVQSEVEEVEEVEEVQEETPTSELF